MSEVTTTSNGAMLGFLERAVSDPGFDVAKFEIVLTAMQAERAKQAEREFYAAMALAQGEMEPIRRDAVNPSTRSKYARFEAIDGQLRPVYTKHGFSVSYRTGTPSRPGSVRVICTVAHRNGHHIEAELEAALDASGAQGRSNKTDVQATGSTVSYLRRYILTMVFNVALANDDDDGEGSRPSQRAAPPPRSHLMPTSLRDMRPRPAPARAEMDRVLDGDDVPDFDAPRAQPKPDRAALVAERFGERMAEVTRLLETEGPDAANERYNSVMGGEGLKAEWAKIRDSRPELDVQMQDQASVALNAIVEARAQAELPA